MEQSNKKLKNELSQLAYDLQKSLERENEISKMTIMASTNVTLAINKHKQMEIKLGKTREQTLEILERYVNKLITLK